MANSVPSIKKNYLYNLCYQILTIITPFISAPYTARIFDADGIGIQSYTNSITSYFVLFAVLGAASYGQREIAQHRENRKKVSQIFWELQILILIITSLVLVIWFIFIFYLADIKYKLFFLIQTISIIEVIFNISWLFFGFENFGIVVFRNIVIKIIGIICLFLFIKSKSDLPLLIGLNCTIGFISTLSFWSFLPQFVDKVSLKELKPFKHFQQVIVYFIPTIATSVYTVLDKTMIGIITKSEYENGYYEQTTKIVKMGLAIVTSLNSVMSSRMSYLFSQKKFQEIKEKLHKSMSFSLFLSIPMVAGLCSIAKNFVPFFFGKGYDKVISLIYIYSFILIPIAISGCLGNQYLTPSGQRAKSSKAIIIGAVTNFILNLVLIPVLHAKGAAIASVIAESIIAIIYIYMSRTYISFKTILTLSFKRIIASALMFFTVFLLGDILSTKFSNIPKFSILLIQIFIGIIVYIVFLIIMKDKIIFEIIDKIKDKLKKKSKENL